MDWEPFIVKDSEELLPPRPLLRNDHSGVGDRMRAAAFAELQAHHAFLWGAEQFAHQISSELLNTWKFLAAQEKKHLELILERMQELGISLSERAVTNGLWIALTSSKTAGEFSHIMAQAEERGRRAGLRLIHFLKENDIKTAEIFQRIADEEIEHVALALKYYPKSY